MAGNAKAIEAGRAFVRLFSDDTALRRGLKLAGERLRSWSMNALKVAGGAFTLGAGILTPILAAVAAYESAGSNLADAAARTGIPVETLSGLRFAAEQSATDLETLEAGLGRMTKVVEKATRGSKGAEAALNDVGLSASALAGLSPDEQFRTIAEALSRIQDPGERAAKAMAIFGKAGTKLLPLMNGGAAGIRDLEEEAKRLGLTMSTEDAAAAETLGDSIGTLKALFGQMAVVIGSTVAPLVQTFTTHAIEASKIVLTWIRDNRELILTAVKIGLALMTAAAAIAAVAVAGLGLSALFSGLSVIIGAVGSVFAFLGSAVAFLVSPLGIVVALVSGLAAYALSAGGAIEWLRSTFSTLTAGAMGAFAAIGKAMSAGDLGLAARVLWTYLKSEWQRGINTLYSAWAGVRNWFVGLWSDAVFGVVRVAFKVWGALKYGFSEAVRFMADAFSAFSSGLMKGWHNTVGFIRKAWTRLKALFNSDINVDAEVERINKETTNNNRRVDTDRDSRISARDQVARENRIKSEQAEKAFLDSLREQQNVADSSREQKYADDLRRSQEELKRAQDDYSATLGEVNALPETATTKPVPTPAEVRVDQAAAGLSNAESKFSSSGTFAAAGVAGLQVGSLDKRIATATEKTAIATKKIADEMDDQGFTLGGD